MITRTLPAFLAAALISGLAASPVLADHNSVWGAGKAKMPNDIHNTRIEDSATMTSEEWRAFVSKGAGAATVNRYLDEEEAEMLPSTRSMSGRVFGGSLRRSRR